MTLPTQRLLTPDEMAEYLGRPRKWVVDHAKQIGGDKVGRYWRFDLEKVRAHLGHQDRLDPLTPTPLSAARQARKYTAA